MDEITRVPSNGRLVRAMAPTNFTASDQRESPFDETDNGTGTHFLTATQSSACPYAYNVYSPRPDLALSDFFAPSLFFNNCLLFHGALYLTSGTNSASREYAGLVLSFRWY